MLTKHDEMMCHQIPSTFDHVIDSGDNWRENVWTSAFDTSGKIFVSSVFGISTNRNVMDAHGLLTIDGKTQYNIRASRELRPGNADVKVGPLSYHIVDGMTTVKILLAENPYGISWEIDLEGRMPAVEEKPQYARSRGRKIEDICRFAQAGRARGWVKVEGKTYDINPDSWYTARDHSWGLRWHHSLHTDGGGFQPPEPMEGFTMDWNVLQFGNWAVASTLREDHNGDILDFSGGLSYAFGENKPTLRMVSQTHDMQIDPTTKRLKSGTVVYTGEDGSNVEISFRVKTIVYIHAGGYWPYKGFRLGRWMGENWIDGEKLDLTNPEDIKPVAEGPLYVVECKCGSEIGYGMIQFSVSGKHPRYIPTRWG